METKQGVSNQVSGTGGGSGSSFPGSVDYFSGVAVAKVGLDNAITGPTSWSFKMAMGTASASVSTDTQLHGCVYMRAGGILVAKYSDDTDACTYTVTGGWLATDELIIVLYTDGTHIQLGIVADGAYSLGTAVGLVAPREIAGFDGGTISLLWVNTYGSILYYNAVIDADTELTGGSHVFNSSILGPQYKQNAEAYSLASGGGPIVDTFVDGFVGLRSVMAIQNLFATGDFSNVTWSKGASVSVTSEAGVNGPYLQAYRYTVSASPTNSNLYTSITTTANETHIATIHFKYVSCTWFRLYISDGGSNQCRVWVNASTGTLGSVTNVGTATGASATLTSIGDGWFKLELSGKVLSTSVFLTLASSLSDNSTTPAQGVLLISDPAIYKSAYPLPYVPPGVTQPASNATNTNGAWFTNPNGSALWNALSGGALTLATKIRMGVGSSDLPVSQSLALISSFAGSREQYCNTDASGTAYITNTFDGTIASPISASWSRDSIITRIMQVNTAGTQFRVGYMIEGMHTNIQWGSWAVYDGSFNPSTLYRLMYGYSNSYPMWLNKLIVWNTQVSDADLLEVLA